MAGQFWVIEGRDGVGKTTQAEILMARLRQSAWLAGKEVVYWHFPHYEGHPWGTLIKDYLSGELGATADEVGPYYAGLLYAADRGQQSPEIQAALQRGDWVVADRYTPSNMAHQGAKIADPSKRQHFYAWLDKLEYQYFAIARPTGIIALTLDAEANHQQLTRRHAKNGSKPDIYESDRPYLERAAAEYEYLAKSQHWYTVACAKGDSVRAPEEIANQVWHIVENYQQTS